MVFDQAGDMQVFQRERLVGLHPCGPEFLQGACGQIGHGFLLALDGQTGSQRFPTTKPLTPSTGARGDVLPSS
jgi:hypothetical protein